MLSWREPHQITRRSIGRARFTRFQPRSDTSSRRTMVIMATTVGPGAPIGTIGVGVSGSDGPRWSLVGISADGTYRQLRHAAHDEVPRAEVMLNALQYEAEAPERTWGTMRHHMEAPFGTLPGVDPISVWAEDAAAASRETTGLDGTVETILLPSGARALWYIPDDGHPGCMAWHENAFAVVQVPEGLDRVLVIYDESRGARLDRAAGDALVRSRALEDESENAPITETSIEWFGFFGDNTIASNGSDGTPSPGGSGTTLEIETDGLPGVLALRAWQWLGSALRKPQRDPLFQARLSNHLQQLDGSPATQEVGDIAIWPSSTAIWIHGTVSSGLASDRSLDGLLAPPNHAPLRYEHDTFLGIEQNVEDLARIIRQRAPAQPDQILLIGHSRGGLVARGTANMLTRQFPGYPVQVVTLGTPHLGTPIVNAAHRALRALVGITTFGISQLPDPASMLLKYLLRYARLPVGIEQMAYKSPFIEGLGIGGAPTSALFSIGADYVRGDWPESTGVRALGRLRNLFRAIGEDANDLVVSVRSATAEGTGRTLVDACGHFEYLRQSEVRTIIRDLASS